MKKRKQLFNTIRMLTLLTVSLMGTSHAAPSSRPNQNQIQQQRTRPVAQGMRYSSLSPIGQALENKDYNAFLSAKKKTGRAITGVTISEAQFLKLVEAHELAKKKPIELLGWLPVVVLNCTMQLKNIC